MTPEPKKFTPLFWVLSIASVVAMLIANVTAFKMVEIGPYVLPAAVFMFPITYILGDVVVEVYGVSQARKVIAASFIANAAMVGYFAFAMWLPSPVWFEGAEAFATVLGSTPRVLAAGLAAFLVGSTINAWIMDKMKGRHGQRFFTLRAVISTIFGETTDAMIFISIAFLGTMANADLLQMIITQAMVKTLYEIIVLPLTVLVKNKVHKIEYGY